MGVPKICLVSVLCHAIMLLIAPISRCYPVDQTRLIRAGGRRADIDIYTNVSHTVQIDIYTNVSHTVQICSTNTMIELVIVVGLVTAVVIQK